MTAETQPVQLVHCAPYVRTPLSAGGATYTQINVSNAELNCELITAHPPAIGDYLHVYDRIAKRGYMLKIVAVRAA